MLFWVFTTSEKQKFLGLYKRNLKNFASEKIFSCKTKLKILKNSIFANFFMRQYFSIPNINLKWFQLSQNYRFSKISSWKLIIWLDQMRLLWCPFWKYVEPQYGFQSFYWRIDMPNFILGHCWWIWVKIVFLGSQ